jgi:hypothetical protein
VTGHLNQFGHARHLVDDRLKLAHYPNSDTLYSLAWLDLAAEPQVLHIPDIEDRYYVVPLASAYNEIFASLRARTKGSGEKRYAIVGANWKGELPAGLEEIRAPTNVIWLLIRTRVANDLYPAERPPGAQASNWLPAPVDRFVLAMRAYLPKEPILDLSYQWPPVRKVD